jgi:hypothetical protein
MLVPLPALCALLPVLAQVGALPQVTAPPADQEPAAPLEGEPLGPVPDQAPVPDGPGRIELFPWEDRESAFGPVGLQFLVRARAQEESESPEGVEDRRGVLLDDARLSVSGLFGERIDFRFSLDGGDEGEEESGEIELLEGWGGFRLGERQHLAVGRFKQPFLRSALVDQGSLLFFDRTVVGEAFDQFDVGLRADGRYEFVDLYAAVQNGQDDTADGRIVTGRAEFHLLGSGVPLDDTLYRASRRAQLSLGLAYSDDSSVQDGSSVAVDAAWRYQNVGLHGELVDVGDDLVDGDRTPWSASLSHMPFPEEWEVGLRFEDLGDADDTWIASAVAKRYFVRGRIAGHLQVDRVDSDDSGLEGWRFLIGTTLSF